MTGLTKVDDGPYGWQDSDGVHYPDKLSYFMTGKLNFCGCGTPDDVAKYIFDMITRHVRPIGDHDWEPAKDHYTPQTEFFLQWLDSIGITEHGSTVFGSWLTDKGVAFIADLKEVLSEVVADE